MDFGSRSDSLPTPEIRPGFILNIHNFHTEFLISQFLSVCDSLGDRKFDLVLSLLLGILLSMILNVFSVFFFV